MRVIYAKPLSLDKVIEGVYYNYETVKRMNDIPNDIIIGSYEQHPNLLLYKDRVAGYIVKQGGIVSHLAIVCRELGIPVYRYNIEELRDGEYIRILTAPPKVDVPPAIRYAMRLIGGRSEIELQKVLNSLPSMPFSVGQVSVKKIQGGYLVSLVIEDFDKLIYQGIENPNELLQKMKQCSEKSILCNIIGNKLAEILLDYLAQRVGYERALRAINRHTPYWTRLDKWYIRIRFPDTDQKVIDGLRRLKKREYERLEGRDEELAKLVAFLVENYERKNILER